MSEKSWKGVSNPEERQDSGTPGVPHSCPAPEEMEKISRYTRREFRPEELYAFTLVLCDNEVDRDMERFSVTALEQLSGLFLGKTGIFNHDPDARQQSARIFDCWTEEVPGCVTSEGEPYRRLMARAYLPRSEENQGLILALESGMQKEVSVGCAVAKQICSVCGCDWRRQACEHRKGQEYGGKTCVGILEDATDAYEWSFVAVPAQKNAGVIKRFFYGAEQAEREDAEKKTEKKRRPSEEEYARLEKRLSQLEKEAETGREYRRDLRENIRRLGTLVLPGLEPEGMKKITEHLSLEELKSMEKAFLQAAGERLPLHPQLAPQKKEEAPGPNPYRI